MYVYLGKVKYDITKSADVCNVVCIPVYNMKNATFADTPDSFVKAFFLAIKMRQRIFFVVLYKIYYKVYTICSFLSALFILTKSRQHFDGKSLCYKL